MGYRGKTVEQAEIERCRRDAADWLGELSERDLLVAGIALYAGEGGKTARGVTFATATLA